MRASFFPMYSAAVCFTFRICSLSSLKEQCHEFVVSVFCLQTISSGPNRHVQKRFRLCSKIPGVIRILNLPSGDEYTGEPIRIFGWGNLFKHKSHVPK
jgi:hypothetical protein